MVTAIVVVEVFVQLVEITLVVDDVWFACLRFLQFCDSLLLGCFLSHGSGHHLELVIGRLHTR